VTHIRLFVRLFVRLFFRLFVRLFVCWLIHYTNNKHGPVYVSLSLSHFLRDAKKWKQCRYAVKDGKIATTIWNLIHLTQMHTIKCLRKSLFYVWKKLDHLTKEKLVQINHHSLSRTLNKSMWKGCSKRKDHTLTIKFSKNINKISNIFWKNTFLKKYFFENLLKMNN
jgi:hypothetical protein